MTTRYMVVLATLAALPACAELCPEGKWNGETCDWLGDVGGTTTGGCQSIDDPNVWLEGYQQFTPAQKLNNPDAGEPSYVYLTTGEAVVIDGPTVASASPLQLRGAGIFLVNQRDTSADGFAVVANDDLLYDVSISDFEYEVTLARVELCDGGGQVKSRFLFAASPEASGVAHDLTISVVKGTPISSSTSSSTPFSIEVR